MKPSKAKARKYPTPDTPGWAVLRHLANSRVPISPARFAEMANVDLHLSFSMLNDAVDIGWFELVEGQANLFMGRL